MAGLYESLMGSAPVDPQSAPVAYRGALPAGPGYVTDLRGDPNGPPVNYRNPELPPPNVPPQKNPLDGLPPALVQFLQSAASVALENELRRKANRK